MAKTQAKTYWIVLPDGAAYDMKLERGKTPVGYLHSGAIFEALAKGDPAAGIDKLDIAKVLDGQETIGFLLGGKRAKELAKELGMAERVEAPPSHGAVQFRDIVRRGDDWYTYRRSTFWSGRHGSIVDRYPFASFAFRADSDLSSRALRSSSWVDFLIWDGEFVLALAVDGIDPVFDHMFAREFSRRGRASGRTAKKGLTNVKVYDRYFGIEETLNGRKTLKLGDIDSAEAVRDILDQITPSHHYSDPLDIELTVKGSRIDDYGPGGQRMYTVDVTLPARRR